MGKAVIELSEQSNIWMSSGSKGQFLELGGKHSTNYLIFNALGQVEMSGTLTKTKRIDIRLLDKGIYFLQFTDQMQETKQFMKL